MLNTGRSPNRREQVQAALTERIVSGRCTPGSMLPTELELAAEFDVSRVVIREAMKVLAERGLIEIRQGRGTTVNSPERWNSLDPTVLKYLSHTKTFYTLQAELLEARLIFEVQLASLAALRISNQELGQLEQLLRQMDQAITDPERFHHLDAAFHIALVAAANNSVMAKLLEPVHDLLTAGFRRTIQTPGAPQEAQVAHWAIYRALKAHDPQATEQAVRTHLYRAQENLSALGNWLYTEAPHLPAHTSSA